MKRCSWCDKIMWPWQVLSDGNTLHMQPCSRIVYRIISENQQQYTVIPEEAPSYTNWQPDEAYEQFLMRIDQENDL